MPGPTWPALHRLAATGLLAMLARVKTKKPPKGGLFRNLFGGRYWTRTSDPYRVKVML